MANLIDGASHLDATSVVGNRSSAEVSGRGTIAGFFLEAEVDDDEGSDIVDEVRLSVSEEDSSDTSDALLMVF